LSVQQHRHRYISRISLIEVLFSWYVGSFFVSLYYVPVSCIIYDHAGLMACETTVNWQSIHAQVSPRVAIANANAWQGLIKAHKKKAPNARVKDELR
jgi:hypothetical protein